MEIPSKCPECGTEEPIKVTSGADDDSILIYFCTECGWQIRVERNQSE